MGRADRPGRAAASTLHFDAVIDAGLRGSVTTIVNDGIVVKNGERVATTGSPHTTPIAPPHGGQRVAPASDTEGGKDGQSATFIEHITNDGYQTDPTTSPRRVAAGRRRATTRPAPRR